MKTLLKRISLYALTVLTLGSALTSVSSADAHALPVSVTAVSDDAVTASRPVSDEMSVLAVSIGSIVGKVGYATKVYEFLKDSRWKNGIKWNGSTKPKASSWNCSGCMAYAVDFCKRVYGEDWASSPKKFTKYQNVNQIATGDAIRINGHYFVVLLRQGNKLYTAEGNYSGKVRASLSTYGYYIENGKLYQNYYNAKGQSTGHKQVQLISIYRHN